MRIGSVLLFAVCVLNLPTCVEAAQPADPSAQESPPATGATGRSTRAGRGSQPAEPAPVPGYSYRVIQGFHTLIHEDVLTHEQDPQFKRRPLEVLEHELKLISGLLPSRPVALLRTVPIWVEWNAPGQPGAVAVYHAGPTEKDRRSGVVFLYRSAEQQAKSNAIEIVNMQSLTAEHQPETDSGRCVLLHELSHAVHHHLFSSENAQIKAAYDLAMSRGLYEDRYAATNEQEYFAELSCAYFDQLAYPPRSQSELKEYDPVGYRLMEMTWGTQQQILAIRDGEARKSFAELVSKLRSLIRNGKLAEATALRDQFQSYYRGTPTAELASKKFDEFVQRTKKKEAKNHPE